MIGFPRFGQLKYLRFTEHRPDELNTDGQSLFCDTGRYRKRGDAREVYEVDEEIAQIHFERIVRFLTQLKRRCRTDGTEHRIVCFKECGHFALNARAHRHAFFVRVTRKLLG